MKIALVSDAWLPQVNGVVTTLLRTREWLERLQHSVLCVTPDSFRSIACPTYPEIRLSIFAAGRVSALLRGFAPDAVHIATEGPLGLAARRFCLRNRFPFTTSYHTRFPQYVRARFPIPERWSYAFLRWFHARAARTMVSTAHVRDELAGHGFASLALWGRGVDTDLFRPYEGGALPGARPILLYAGRVAVEKNLEAFLSLDTPGTKYVVGDGPALQALRSRYPQAVFTGYQHGEALARHIASADVFVFPSRTDTFGLVLLEAMACGVPVAAYPVPGPIDVVRQSVTGCLDQDLGAAVAQALRLQRDECRRYALGFSWERATRQFLGNLEPRAVGVGAVALL